MKTGSMKTGLHGPLAVAALLASCIACTPREDTGAPGSVFRFSEDGSPTTMAPTQSGTIYDSILIKNLYDTLYEYKYLKRPYEIKPNLATALPEVSEDGLTYTVRIRPGVHYIDDPCFRDGKGRELVAADLVYSLKRHFDPRSRSKNAWLWRGHLSGLDEWGEKGPDYAQEVEGLKALDKYTIQFKLTRPYPQLVFTLAMAPSAFVPREAVQKYGLELSVHPVGSGPYRLLSYNTKKAVLVRNENYREVRLNLAEEGYDPAEHGKYDIEELDGMLLPITDRVELSFMKESTARWNSFTKGDEIQYGRVPIELVDEILASKKPVRLSPEYAEKYYYRSELEFGLVYSNFNMDDPRIGYNEDRERERRNKLLRRAIRKAFSWRERIDNFYYGIGEAFPGIIPPGIDGYDPALSRDSVEADFDEAKRLLAEGGWNAENLPVLEYGGVSAVRQKQFFEQFRGWMRRIGYPNEKIKFKSYATFGDYNEAMRARKVMFHGLGWAIDYPDSENLLQLYYGPNQSPGSNSSNYDNPEYNELFEKASVMPPSPERTRIYQRLNRMIIDDCVTIAGFSRTRITVWHKDVLAYPDRDVLGGYFLKYVGIRGALKKRTATAPADGKSGAGS